VTATPPPIPTPFARDVARARLADEQFDVLVIGGGITGAGVALDAASRGLRTALVERDDFASGTSSKSSKLVHGGLRYLQQKEFVLVYENLAERQRLLENAPHLVHPLPFLIPLFGKEGTVNKAVARIYNNALWMYDLTGGLRIGKRHRRISRDETLAHMPTLDTRKLVAGFLYYDAQADDARLTLTIARTAVVDYGAAALNHAGVTELVKDASGRAVGARLDNDIEIRARAVVNAAGVWSDDVRALDEGQHPQSIRPAKGVHVSVPWAKVRCDIAAVVPVRKDGRSVFVVPWGDRVYIGTTDTDYDGPLDHPTCTPADITYLLDAVNTWLTEPISEDDILGTWAGLRPLVRDAKSEKTADLSRRHDVSRSSSGVVTVTGGKLTTYRKMAADSVDAVVEVLARDSHRKDHEGNGPGRIKRSQTKHLPLRGAGSTEALLAAGAAERLGTNPRVLEHLVGRYGSEARTLLAMVRAQPQLAEPLVATLPYLKVEAVYAARYEMAATLDDVLARRTRAQLLARDASAAAASDVARLIAPDLGWSDSDADAHAAAYRAAVADERSSSGLSETAIERVIGA
jgi:glycerol-3-phosphate dehydrogenase